MTRPSIQSPPPPGGREPSATTRALSHVVSMVVVAAGVWVIAADRAAPQQAEIDALRARLDGLERENRRVRRLNDALADAAHAAGVDAHTARWQVGVLEERLESAAREELPVPTGLSPRAAWAAEDAVEPLTEARGEPQVEAPWALEPRPSPLSPLSPLQPGDESDALQPLPEPAGLPMVAWAPHADLQLAERDLTLPPLRRAPSQLDRDRAYGDWKLLVEEVVAQECGGWSADAPPQRCALRVRRALFPFGPAAVSCALSGNAQADYVSDVTLDHLPSHAVPLRHGAVILCDDALRGL